MKLSMQVLGFHRFGLISRQRRVMPLGHESHFRPAHASVLHTSRSLCSAVLRTSKHAAEFLLHFSSEARHSGASLFDWPKCLWEGRRAAPSSPLPKLPRSGVEVRFFVGPLHELRLRHVVDGPHFKNGILVDLWQFPVAWKCRAGPAYELDSRIVH